MTSHVGGVQGEKIHTVQPERDLVANWEVDLSEKLEEYLLKICSGEITGNEEDGQIPVNFAEAALLLQGSVQVYSKKVEYLYNLVLRTLEFLSKQREEEQTKGASNKAEESSGQVDEEENDLFWNVDDIPVDTKNCLDSSAGEDSCPSQFVKPPANLVVLEGDCLDTGGDGGELESYLLATTHLYRNFILLDPCDAVAVNEFLGDNYASKGKSSAHRDSSVRKGFLSPGGRLGGSARKSSLGKNVNLSPIYGDGPDVQNCGLGSQPPVFSNFADNDDGCDMDNEHGGNMGLSDTDADEDDPWKPLNPYEPGKLKVKPFKKVKTFRKIGGSLTKDHITSMFPLARPHGPISPELTGVWEMHHRAAKNEGESHDIPYYEKLRQLLVNGENQPSDGNGNHKTDDEDNHDEANNGDFHDHDDDDPQHAFMDEDVLNKNIGGAAEFHSHDAFGNDESHCQESLEDLCRSHLDALLANIAKSEKQTDLAARVSSWKQKIELNLEEQELHPPFDIQEYGERIINKLTVEESENIETFADLMKNQEKHEVARSFSALLQLVNNGDVDLEKPGNTNEPVCYTAVNPFSVRLLGDRNRKDEKRAIHLPRKRAKSPITKDKNHESSPPLKNSNTCSVSSQTRKVSLKISKINSWSTRCTPDSKKRRKGCRVDRNQLEIGKVTKVSSTKRSLGKL